MSICKNCHHECHHSNNGLCHCGCDNCEHDVQEAINKLNKVLTINGDLELEVEFFPDFNITEHQEVKMKLLKDTWQWIKEWNEWGMKDWIKAGVIAAIAIAVLSGMAG